MKSRNALWVLLIFLALPAEHGWGVERTGINSNAVLESSFRFFRSEDLRKSIKWKGYVAALEHAAGGNWPRTREFVFKLRELVPGNAMLMEQEARLRMRDGEWSIAESIWYELFARQPHRLDILPELAWVLLHQDQDDEARRICGVVLNRNPRQVEARLIRALLALRNPEDRETEAEQWTLREMAHLCQLLGSRPRAWVHVVGEDGYRELMAQVWGGGVRGNGARLVAPLPELTRQSRENAKALIELEKAMALQQNERARNAMDRLKDGQVSAPLLSAYQGYLLAREGNVTEAEQRFQTVIASHPSHVQILHMWAALLVEIGRGEDALVELIPMRIGRKSDPDLQFLQMLAYLQTERMTEAWNSFRHLAEEHRGDLLRLLRQDEPLLDLLRSNPEFLDRLRTPPIKKESATGS